jgi:hypothetical protein
MQIQIICVIHIKLDYCSRWQKLKKKIPVPKWHRNSVADDDDDDDDDKHEERGLGVGRTTKCALIWESWISD